MMPCTPRPQRQAAQTGGTTVAKLSKSKSVSRSLERRAARHVADRAIAGKYLARSGVRRLRRVLKTSELIARDIILDIFEGGLKAGDALPPEASMLKQYEVGRASLREALRLLEVQGLVHIRAGATGGPVVGAATAENLARMLTLFFGLAGATYEDLADRSEEHTSELQSRLHLVCRLLL